MCVCVFWTFTNRKNGNCTLFRWYHKNRRIEYDTKWKSWPSAFSFEFSSVFFFFSFWFLLFGKFRPSFTILIDSFKRVLHDALKLLSVLTRVQPSRTERFKVSTWPIDILLISKWSHMNEWWHFWRWNFTIYKEMGFLLVFVCWQCMPILFIISRVIRLKWGIFSRKFFLIIFFFLSAMNKSEHCWIIDCTYTGSCAGAYNA